MRGVVFYDNALDDDGVVVTGLSGGSLQGRHPDALIDGRPFNVWGPTPYALTETWVKIDLGTEQAIVGVGIINHNFYVANLSYVAVGGNNDGGSSYTLVTTLTGLESTNHDPCTAKTCAAKTFRYWRFTFAASTSANYLGGLYLARRAGEFGETPDAPFQEDQHNQIVSAVTEGGYERRQVRGEPFYSRALRWKGTTESMALQAREMWLKQHGRSRLFLYAAHDKGQPTGSGNYIPEVLRFAGMSVRDLPPGSRYSVLMTLVGLLRIDH